MRWLDWVDERIGLRGLARSLADEPVPGGARWAYVFGSGLLFLFVLQAVTGVFLALYYVPSADHAHASLAYIQKAVPAGAYLRGLHSYGASAVVILLVLHLGQVFLFAAFKGKRELIWLSGLAMLGLMLAMAFTGYLLPWDQEAYFATKVGTSIAAEIPLVGPPTQRALLGGTELTTLTLSRFYMLHAFVLPGLILLLVSFHLYAFRRAGPAGHYRAQEPRETFYPRQFFYDVAFVALLFVILSVLAIVEPAPLGPQADPTSDYLARPPWYFLPLLELLKYAPGPLVLLPAVVLPGLVFVVLALVPFLARTAERHPTRRPAAVAVFLAAALGAGMLIVLAKVQDARDPQVRARMELQAAEARAFQREPFQPQQIGRSVPIEPPVVAQPPVRIPRPLSIYFANCANCHGADARGGPLGPSLVRVARRRGWTEAALVEWIRGHGREPTANGMPHFAQLEEEDLKEMAKWLVALTTPIPVGGRPTPAPSREVAQKRAEVQEAPPAFIPAPPPPIAAPAAAPENVPDPPDIFIERCSFCHGPKALGNIGPSLYGVTLRPERSPDDLFKLLQDPRAYGLKEPMPAAFPGLSDDDRRTIIEWLSRLK